MSTLNAALCQMVVVVRSLFSNEKGATATEYALLVGLIAIVIIVGVTAFGTSLNNLFTNISGTVGGW